MAVDLAAGELPNRLHPVAWMGHVIAWCTARAPQHGAWAQLAYGAALAVGLPALFAGIAWALLRLSGGAPWLHFLCGVALLKSTFALRALGEAGERMQSALLQLPNLSAARGALGHLCSRDPSALEAPQLIAATVESVAENASDSVVAPLLFYAVGGLPAAVAYRTVNTLDAMIGYHGRYEYLGKAAARLDDVLNLIPARLTAALLLAAGGLHRLNVGRGLRTLRRDRRLTESPNAGYPMATMAGLLGVRLEKPQCYALGEAIMPLTGGSIGAAWHTVRTAALLLVAGLCLRMTS